MQQALDAINLYFTTTNLTAQLMEYVQVLGNVTIAVFVYTLVARCLRAAGQGTANI